MADQGEDTIAALVEKAGAEECGTALSTVTQLLENASTDPEKYGTINRSSRVLKARLLDVPGGEEVLPALGFVPNDDAYVFNTSLEPGRIAARVQLVKTVSAQIEALTAAIVAIGDQNVPDAARNAVKLARIYCGNILANAGDDAKRRIAAANKALSSRLLAASGGLRLLKACGFEAEGEPPEAFVCQANALALRVTCAVIDKADAVWAGLAARAPDSGGSAGDAGAGDHTSVAPAVSGFTIARLPTVASLADRRGGADLEPALVVDAQRTAVQLHTWMAVSKRWRLVGSMQIPSSHFEWVRAPVGSGQYELVVEVDFGDGQPVELGLGVPDGQPENEYVAAQRFIGEHFEHLNNNHLEEIAKDLRARSAPVLETVANLVRAMEEQN